MSPTEGGLALVTTMEVRRHLRKVFSAKWVSRRPKRTTVASIQVRSGFRAKLIARPRPRLAAVHTTSQVGLLGADEGRVAGSQLLAFPMPTDQT